MGITIKKCFIIRGLPGSGKSTFAKTLMSVMDLTVHCEADQFMYNEDGVYDWKPSKVKYAHNACFEKFQNAVAVGKNVIVSNTFTRMSEFEAYVKYATECGYEVTVMTVNNIHGNSSVHNVPEGTMTNMRSRFEPYL